MTSNPSSNLEAVEAWKDEFIPLNMVGAIPPKWIIPGVLVPGFNLVVGPPKAFKSFLVLKMAAALVHWLPVMGKRNSISTTKGSVVYFPSEQSPGRLKHVYETRILKRKMQQKRTDWDLTISKNPWAWQLDDHAEKWIQWVEHWQPTVLIIDPFIYFHSEDENSPKVVKPLIPLRAAMLKHGGALVVVHHLKKPSADPRGVAKSGDWNQIRGTGALWGAADGAMMLNKRGNNVNVAAEFKDFPASNWSFSV